MPTGTVDDPAATVTVNDRDAVVDGAGNFSISDVILLIEGMNPINAYATTPGLSIESKDAIQVEFAPLVSVDWVMEPGTSQYHQVAPFDIPPELHYPNGISATLGLVGSQSAGFSITGAALYRSAGKVDGYFYLYAYSSRPPGIYIFDLEIYLRNTSGGPIIYTYVIEQRVEVVPSGSLP